MADVLPLPVRACGSGAVVVELTGDLDFANAPSLSAAMSELQVRSARPGLLVLLDLSRLEFCDISGLRAMACADRKLAERGARLALVAPRRNFMRLLRAAKLSGCFEVLPSLPAAKAPAKELIRTGAGRAPASRD
jgi:anti-sigma B factor antagonist